MRSILNIDRYHAVMAEFLVQLLRKLSLNEPKDFEVSFYLTQRKASYSVVFGVDRVLESLRALQLDHPRQVFLANDRAGLSSVANLLAKPYPGRVRVVRPGTLVFANQPVLDVEGSFAAVQMAEVGLEHWLDTAATFSHRALEYKLALAGAEGLSGKSLRTALNLDGASGPFLSDFSQRRCGDPERAALLATIAYICGWNDTSNMEAAYSLGIPSVGTQAHYLLQFAVGLVKRLIDNGRNDLLLDERGVVKHPERVMFELWLDHHPKGTALLIDTFGLALGVRHATEAALSSPARRAALRFVRLDSGDPVASALFTRRFLDANELKDVGIIVTGDVTPEIIRRLREAGERFGGRPTYLFDGVGVGTAYAAEYGKVAGAIFKMTLACGVPVAKYADGKSTFPGRLQLRRFYRGKIITRQETCLDGEEPRYMPGEDRYEDLLRPIHGYPETEPIYEPDPAELRGIVWDQILALDLPLEAFAKERVSVSYDLRRLVEQTQIQALDSTTTLLRLPATDYAHCLDEVAAER